MYVCMYVCMCVCIYMYTHIYVLVCGIWVLSCLLCTEFQSVCDTSHVFWYGQYIIWVLKFASIFMNIFSVVSCAY
jgi:hypothetical protein